MKIARRIASILLKLLATGAFSLLLAACYGVVAAMYGVPARYGTIKVRDSSTHSPIPGIKVSFRSSTSMETVQEAQWESYPVLSDKDGEIDYEYGYIDSALEAKLDDIDGTLNGSYQSATATIDEESEIVELYPDPAK